jgi:hypothetical protein
MTVVFVAVVALAGAFIAWAVPGLGPCGQEFPFPEGRAGARMTDLCDRRATWTPLLLGGPSGLVVIGGIVGKAVRHWWPSAVALLLGTVLVIVPYFVLMRAYVPLQSQHGAQAPTAAA